jgi:hypothetical protein
LPLRPGGNGLGVAEEGGGHEVDGLAGNLDLWAPVFRSVELANNASRPMAGTAE